MYRSKMFLGVVVVAMAIASLLVVGPASAAGPTGNPFVAKAQDTSNGQVTIASFNAPADGWIVIRKDANGAPGGVLGWAAVHQGMNQNVTVDIRNTDKAGNDQVTPTIWATFVADANAMTPLASPSGIDTWMGGPALAFGSSAAQGAPALTPKTPVIGTAPTTGGQASAPMGQFVAKAQDTSNGQVTIASFNAPADGWIVIRKDANGAPGGVLGWAAVHQGMNQNVTVDIRNTDKAGNDQVTPTIWATFVADANAMTPLASPSGIDTWTGGPAVPFGSSAAQGAAK